MSTFILPTTARLSQDWMADFDDWNGDGIVDYPGGFYKTIGWDGHNGLDYGCRIGMPIVAAADGIVEFCGPAGNHWLLSGGGNVVLLKHPEHNVRTEYLHLREASVYPGQVVKQGQVIGRSGNSGASTAPHLHFGFIPLAGVNVGNRARGRVNPYLYLGGTITVSGSTITKEQEDDIMATRADRQALINELLTHPIAQADGTITNLQSLVAEDRDHHREIVNAIGNVPGRVLNTTIPRGGERGGDTTLAAVASWHDAHVVAIIDSVSKATGADVSLIKQAVLDGLKEGITVTIAGEKK